MRKLLARLTGFQDIRNGNGAPYLRRWRILRTKVLIVYLHHFVGDDWPAPMHDHPARFISIGLWGSYVEETEVDGVYITGSFRTYRAPWVRTFPATHRHWILLPSTRELRTCWTLVIQGPKERTWYFYPEGRRVHWREYLGLAGQRPAERGL